MDDEKYVYHTDIRERKEAARSAKNAGSKRRRGCSLPADFMTKEEMQEMNGPEITIDYRKPMTWADFRRMPAEHQKAYCDAILAEYDIGPVAFAKMFGVVRQYCATYLHEVGVRFKGKGRPSETSRFLKAYTAKSGEPAVVAPKAKATETVAETSTPAAALTSAMLTITGPFDPEVVLQKLCGLFETGEPVIVRVEVAKVAK